MSSLSLRQTVILVALFVVTAVVFIQLDTARALGPIRSALETIVTPLTDGISGIGRGSESALEQELAVVKAERDALLAENAALRADVREVEQLRLQAKLQRERPSWKMLQARVQGSDPSGQQLFLTINKGSADGVEPGMAVVAQGQNYVGQVTEVSERTSKVMLIIDVSQTVGAKLDSGPDGVVYGLSRRGGWLVMRYLDPDAKIAPNELVLTSDSPALRTAKVPGGLIIGKAVTEKIERDQQADTQAVEVVPLVNYEALQVVTVVLTDGT